MKIYGIDCEYSKKILSYKGLIIGKGKNEKECVRNMIKRINLSKKDRTCRQYFLGAVKTADGKPERDRLNKIRNDNWRSYEKEFNKTFKHYPKTDNIFMMIDGSKRLDIFWFERLIEVPENKSMSNYIKEKYGTEAEKLIKNMI